MDDRIGFTPAEGEQEVAGTESQFKPMPGKVEREKVFSSQELTGVDARNVFTLSWIRALDGICHHEGIDRVELSKRLNENEVLAEIDKFLQSPQGERFRRYEVYPNTEEPTIDAKELYFLIFNDKMREVLLRNSLKEQK